MNPSPSLAKRVTAALAARHETQQWEQFIVSLLKRLELTPEERGRAEEHYKKLAKQVALKLDIGDTDVHVIVQGSMRTQTTISPRGNQKFDLDIVVKLNGGRFANVSADQFFREFGEALNGLTDAAGTPEPKNRCWRLQYPGEPFYFDVTPAIPGSLEITGTDLRVRDPVTQWSPSNPEEFADWFCTIAGQRFAFQEAIGLRKAEARHTIDPLPAQPVGIDDILRRAVQLMKLHRDNVYFYGTDAQKEAQPISCVLVTLAAKAYDFGELRTACSPLPLKSSWRWSS